MPVQSRSNYVSLRSEGLRFMDLHWSHGYDREAAMKHALLGSLNSESQKVMPSLAHDFARPSASSASRCYLSSSIELMIL
jgi:hypothetical protein